MSLTNRYPDSRQILWVALLALPLVHFAVWPLARILSARAGLALAELSVTAVMAFFLRRRRLPAEEVLLLNAVPLATLVVAGLTALAASLVIAEVDLLQLDLLAALGWELPPVVQRAQLEVQLARDLPGLLAAVLTVAILPGICEELFFRGFAFSGLYAHHGPGVAVSGSAALFAAAHMNPWQFTALLLFGLFLGLLVFWTHSIYPAILAHLVNNGMSLIATNLRAYHGLEILNPHLHLPGALTVLAAGLAAAGLWWLSRQPAVMPLPPSPDPALRGPGSSGPG
ncbi:MAG: type II CAAX endopeptidase family protein [Candidatus Latescibacterota bacterium]